MARRMIDTDVWSDPKFTDDFTPEDKYFWLFLLTTRYGNLSGVFQLTYNQIAQDMGYSIETVKNLIFRFTKIHKMIDYDERTQEVFIFNWYKYNWSRSPKAEANIMRFANDLKSEKYRNAITNMYQDFKENDTLSIPYRYLTISISNTKSNTITNSITNISDITNGKSKEVKLTPAQKNNLYLEDKYFDDEELQEVFIEYLQLRIKSKMTMTDRVISRLLNKIEEQPKSLKVEMIEKAIIGGWKDFYTIESKDEPKKKEYEFNLS